MNDNRTIYLAGHYPPGESAGELPVRTRWALSEQISLAFGYGLTASPLQLASAYTVFANDGVRPPVSLLALEATMIALMG